MRHCGTELGFWIPDGPTSNRITDAASPGVPSYNQETAAACIAACRGRRGTAIDGGAYIGTFSAHLVNHFQRVIAFEPLAENFECAKLNVPQAEWHNMALSNVTGSVRMGQPNAKLKTYQWRIGEPDHALDVPSMAIDDLGLTDVALIKLDVEGHELQALQGARTTLVMCRPVVLIEEKLDPRKRASMMLQEFGMRVAGNWKHDWLFVW